MKLIKWFFLAGVGALSAYFSFTLFLVYVVALFTFVIFSFVLGRFGKKSPKKTFDKMNQRMQKQPESNGEPYITTHHGPEGIKGLEIGFDDEADEQPGAGRFNPTQVTLAVAEMRTEEAKAEAAKAVRDILNSSLPYHLKQAALAQLEKHPVKQPKTDETKHRVRRRRRDDDFVGLSQGKYSIE